MTGHSAYVLHLLVWGAPVLIGQMVILGWRRQLGDVLRAVLLPALAVAAWLSAVDSYAIHQGLWRFPDGKHLGVTIAAVPVEEVLFFVMSSMLSALGYALFLGTGRRRASP